MRVWIITATIALTGFAGCGPKGPEPTTPEIIAAQKKAEQEVQSAESAMQKKQPKTVQRSAEDEERARQR
ncbi:hypothetical protein [Limnoglobus roseus]|uniref:Uncharacterized protein n=1 Tax=Limnoglobus roseus TaxID=2598579 RepID=A0A5C1ARX7_9BACT|nr:hypothetical protein [Limnoglobus roseus]QEL19638.1 hypothetical protein PX52LOC_06715 [Limnoglobus roseus]